MYNLNRVYFSSLGIYLEPDFFDIKSNLYQYANADPINNCDINGKKVHHYLTHGESLEGGIKLKGRLAGMVIDGVAYSECYPEDPDNLQSCRKKMVVKFNAGIFGLSIDKSWLSLPVDFEKFEAMFSSITADYPKPTKHEFTGMAEFSAFSISIIIANEEIDFVPLQLGKVRQEYYNGNSWPKNEVQVANYIGMSLGYWDKENDCESISSDK